MRLFSLCISLPASSLRRSGSRAKRESEELARKAFLNDGRQQEVKPFPCDRCPKTPKMLSVKALLEPLVKATFRKRPRSLFGLTVLEFSIVFNLLLNSEVYCKIGQKLKEFIIWLSLLPTHLLLC